jgi:hypothetical protein
MKKVNKQKTNKQPIVPSVLYVFFFIHHHSSTIEEVIQQKEKREHAQEKKKRQQDSIVFLFSGFFLKYIYIMIYVKYISHKINTIKIWKMYLQSKEYR